MYSFKKFAAALVIAGMLAPAAASAQTSTSTIQMLLDQIKALQLQINAAQQQQQVAIGQLMVTLNTGSRGENVRMLQQLLASDPTIYPEGKVTGIFGKLTAAAVKRFQKKHGIEQVGNVGPKTLRKLNEIFGHMGNSSMMGSSTMGWKGNDDRDDDDDNKPCIGQGRYAAPGWLKNFGEDGRGKEFKGREDDARPCVATTTPPVVTDTTAPIISAVSASGVATTTATVTWSTNENTTGKVYFGTANPLVLGSATTQATTTLSGTHSFALTGLSASTTYYFVVESADASNNTSTSTQATFTTTN